MWIRSQLKRSETGIQGLDYSRASLPLSPNLVPRRSDENMLKYAGTSQDYPRHESSYNVHCPQEKRFNLSGLTLFDVSFSFKLQPAGKDDKKLSPVRLADGSGEIL